MQSVIGISWPRSGHHMLVRLLSRYFGRGFGYCEFYVGRPNVGGITACCKQVPCTHHKIVHLTKNHDFDFSTPQLTNQKYLIQYRDFPPSVVSNFELFVRNGEEDSALSFQKFASMEFGRYRRFIAKWVLSDFAQGQLLLNYSHFLKNPMSDLARTVAFFKPDEPVDKARMIEAIHTVDGEQIESRKVHVLRGVGVHNERETSAFRYFEPHLFRLLGRLKLTRDEVLESFRSVLEREPPETSILELQCFATRPDLEADLRKARDNPQHQCLFSAIQGSKQRKPLAQ